jgi:hypothetical protein
VTLPADVRYGTVTATFPDPPEGLQVRFRPDLRQPVARLTTVSPPLTFALETITATVDSAGQLTGPDGQIGVRLLADPDLEPAGWTWHVRISSPSTAAVDVSIPVPAGATVDLSTAVPVPPDLGQALADWLQAVTLAQAARDEAARIASTVEAGSAAAISSALADLVGAAPEALNTLQEIDATIAADEGSAAALAALVGRKAPLDSPAFTGTVSGITPAMVGTDPAGDAVDPTARSDIAAMTQRLTPHYAVADLGIGDGNAHWTAPGSGLTTVPVVLEASTDPGAWHPDTSAWTVPVSGLYQLSAALRPTDSYPAGSNIGLGVGTSLDGGPTFLWNGVTTALRHTFQLSRTTHLDAGDEVFLYTFMEGPGTVVTAALSINLIAAD